MNKERQTASIKFVESLRSGSAKIMSFHVSILDFPINKRCPTVLTLRLKDSTEIYCHGRCVKLSDAKKIGFDSLLYTIDSCTYSGLKETFEAFVSNGFKVNTAVLVSDLIEFDPDFKSKSTVELKNYKPSTSRVVETPEEKASWMMRWVEKVVFAAIYPFVGLFWLSIWSERLYFWWLKKYYTWRGIKFIVQRDKFSDVVMRLDK